MIKNNNFIRTSARVLSIIQLCLGLISLLSVLQFPFMGALYYYKSEMLLYEQLLGRKGEDNSHFLSLPKKDQSNLLTKYSELASLRDEGFLLKLSKMFTLLKSYLSIYELIWILLSISIPIMLLLKTEGAIQAAWLLPLITLIFAIDNQINGITVKGPEAFFPAEGEIIFKYLKRPLGASLKEQQEDLKLGWKIYLVEEWAKETPSNDEGLFQKQADKGLFAFNYNRVNKQTPFSYSSYFREKRSPATLIAFLIWNLFFAAAITKILLFRLKKFDCV